MLSFPALDADEQLEGLIGDISLARETLGREAGAQGITFEAHFTHLLVHGFLHCLGFDHQTNEEALVMEALETQILQVLGIDDPYADG